MAKFKEWDAGQGDLSTIEAELSAVSRQRRASSAPPQPHPAQPPSRGEPHGRGGDPYGHSPAAPSPGGPPLASVVSDGFPDEARRAGHAGHASHPDGATPSPGSHLLPLNDVGERLGAPSPAGGMAAPDSVARPLQPVAQLSANAQPDRSPLGGMMPSAAEDWLALMPTLLRSMASNAAMASQRDGLHKLQKMALCAPPDAPVWSAHFEHALEAVLRSAQCSDDKMREQGIACLKDLLRSQSKRFKAFTEHVLLRLLAAGRDASREVATAAEEALELLLSLSDAHRCMAVLVPVVMKEAPPTLQLAVRLQSKLVPRFSQLQLLAILPQVLPPLFEAFKHANADVRKAVVFCLVDMYMVRHTRPLSNRGRPPQSPPVPANPPTAPRYDRCSASS